ncbi:thermonuclease family protein [Bacillus sp. RO1]|uniref:thermonuclease family protein n=1 Tax=Bacillus sp. RO1 TaxID=2722703 RepID=UPI0014565658|nr:thermonuclease family protein [Bacillus sp. RO1]NLP51336.1 nuclease [Bacillus sp. RO1]
MRIKLYTWFLVLVLVLAGCSLDESSSTVTENNSTKSVQELVDPPDESSSKTETETENLEETEPEYERTEVPLVRVIDGDTIKVIINNKEENIRFLLVDTPETNHPRMDGPQPFGPEAKKFMEEFMEDGKVEIELDVSERDHYGRILAYVFVNGLSAQEELLKRGLARVAYIFPPNTRYVDTYQAIQKKAQAEGIGIWSVENYAQEDGFFPEYVEDPVAVVPTEENPVSESCKVKGNISSSGEKIYHVKTGAYYDRTIPEACFNSEEEAEKAGYRKSMR